MTASSASAATSSASRPSSFLRPTPALRLATRRGVSSCWAPTGRAVIFLIATIAIGPGLIVNLGLKDHAHRPRPVQTRSSADRASSGRGTTTGACKKNCSFVSGEAATGFWMVAPASVLPPPWRGPAIVAAFAFGVGASLLRMAFGGHYLSDVLLGGLVTLIVIDIARRLLWPRSGAETGEGSDAMEGKTAAELVDAALNGARESR